MMQFGSMLIPALFYSHLVFKPTFNFKLVNLGLVKKAISYSAIAIIGILSVPLTEFLIREMIIDNINYINAGLWQSMNRISVALTSFFIAFLHIIYCQIYLITQN